MSEEWSPYRIRDLAASAPLSFTDGDWIEAPHIRDEGIRLIQTGNIGIGEFIDRSKKYISESSLTALHCKEVFPNDLLICRLAEPIGRACFAPSSGERMITSVDVAILRVAKDSFDPKFVSFCINTQNFLRMCEIVSGGTTRQRISRSNLGEIKIKAPKLAQQRRIAEILTTVDEAMEQTEALVGKLEQMKAGLMHDLFTRGVWTQKELDRGDHQGFLPGKTKGVPTEALAKEGHLRPTRQEAPHLYHQTPLGWLPKEWEVVTTEDCAAKVPGSTTIGPFGSDLVSGDYQTEGVPVVFVRDVKENGFEWNSGVYVTERKAERLRAHAVRPGDILSTKMGLPPCISCRYPEWMAEGIVTADIIRLRPDLSLVNPEWLAAVLNGEAFKRQVQTITAGVTRPKVTLGDYRKLRVARPLLDEQNLIAERLASDNRLMEAELEKLAKLRQQKQGLMQDLLTGRVRVE